LTDFALKANETKIYIATFTPTLNSVTAGTISVASDKFSDAAGNINVALVALKPTPPNTTLIDLISVSVVFEISASKATPTAISERVNSALLVQLMTN
jgi:hypothetical protein